MQESVAFGGTQVNGVLASAYYIHALCAHFAILSLWNLYDSDRSIVYLQVQGSTLKAHLFLHVKLGLSPQQSRSPLIPEFPVIIRT